MFEQIDAFEGLPRRCDLFWLNLAARYSCGFPVPHCTNLSALAARRCRSSTHTLPMHTSSCWSLIFKQACGLHDGWSAGKAGWSFDCSKRKWMQHDRKPCLQKQTVYPTPIADANLDSISITHISALPSCCCGIPCHNRASAASGSMGADA